MFIRPKIRPSLGAPMQFVTLVGVRGTRYSQWLADLACIPIPSGTPGRVGEVVDKINLGQGSINHSAPKPWSPPNEFEFYAKKMGLGEDFLLKCGAWHAEHPSKSLSSPNATCDIDSEPIAKMMHKYSKKGPPLTPEGPPQPTRPPMDRMALALECAGYTNEQIDRFISRSKYADSRMEERQAALDKIFGNYPSASKPSSKNKSKKVIKAVKKKMT